jgi:hypothetical protein
MVLEVGSKIGAGKVDTDTGIRAVHAPSLSPLDLVEPSIHQAEPRESGRRDRACRNTHRWTPAMLAAEEKRLVDYLEEQVAQHGAVPSSRARPELPSTSMMAEKSGVRRSQISLEGGRLKGVLDNYITTHGLKPYDGAAGVHFERSDQVHATLLSYIQGRADAGLGLPSTNGKPNMAAIARGADISASTLTDKMHRNHNLVMEKFMTMGGGTEDPKRSGPLVLTELLAELEGRQLRPELEPYRRSLLHLRHVVKLAIGLHALGDEAPATEALEAAREMTDKADVRSRLATCIRIVEQIEKDDLVPQQLGAAIDFLCRRANYQPHDLAMDSGAGWKMHDWRRGRSAPDRFCSYGAVKKMEELVASEPGTLWNRVRYRSCALGTIPKEFWPEEIQDDALIKKEIKFYLPDEILTLPDTERRELILTAYGVVMLKRQKHVDENHAANCADPYRHKAPDWGPTLVEDMEALFAFHSFKPDIDFDSEDNDTHWVKGTRERSQTYVEKTTATETDRQPPRQ